MIKGPPTNPRRYLTAAAGRLDELAAKLAAAADAVRRSESRRGERMLFDFLRYGGTEPEEAAAVLSAGSVVARLAAGPSGYSIANVADDVRSVLNHGVDHVRFLVTSAKAACEPERHAEALFAVLGEEGAGAAEAGAEAYGFVPGDPANLDDEDFAAATEMLRALREACAAYREATELAGDVAERLGAMSAARAMAYSRAPWRPQHGPVETLWHASAHASDIAENGFAPEKPEGRRGLGAFGDLPLVSFTYEKALAENVAAALREVWDIVHRRLAAQEIVRRVREEGIDRKCDLRRYVGAEDLDSLSTPQQALRLYWVYLSLSEKMDNPVFASFEELATSLEGVRREDIGVVECRVELLGNEEHLVGECEFRVPPAQVLEASLLAWPGQEALAGDVPGRKF